MFYSALAARAFDESTGLQNNLNRWLDADSGKWLSEDPIGFTAGDANLARYVSNHPTGATDPSGLFVPINVSADRVQAISDGIQRRADFRKNLRNAKITLHLINTTIDSIEYHKKEMARWAAKKGVCPKDTDAFIEDTKKDLANLLEAYSRYLLAATKAGITSEELNGLPTGNIRGYSVGSLELAHAIAVEGQRQRRVAGVAAGPPPKSYWAGVGEVFKGYGDAAVGTIKGLWAFGRAVVSDPGGLAKGIGHTILHPFDTASAIYDDFVKKTKTLRGQGELVGGVLIGVLTGGAAKSTEGVKFIQKAQKVLDKVKGKLHGFRKGAECATKRVLSPAGDAFEVLPAQTHRVIQRGEKIADIIEEAKTLTYVNDLEYALVKLKNGDRVLVHGGRGGIEFGDDVTRIFGHTHPQSYPGLGVPSKADVRLLHQLDQRSSYFYEHGELFRFNIDSITGGF